MQFVFVSNIQNAYDCGYGTKFNAVCDRISFRQNVHKIIFKIDDITNHSKIESICQLFPYIAFLVGF